MILYTVQYAVQDHDDTVQEHDDIIQDAVQDHDDVQDNDVQAYVDFTGQEQNKDFCTGTC